MEYDSISEIDIEHIEGIDIDRKIVALSFMKKTNRENVQNVLLPILQKTGPIYNMDSETMDNILKKMLLSRNSQIRETTEKSIMIASKLNPKQMQRTLEKEKMELNRRRITL